MAGWLLRRTGLALLTWACAVVLLFGLMRAAPGDPLQRADGRELQPAERTALRARFGLDQPLGAQFAAFVGGLAHGDLGVSLEHYPERVTALVAHRLPASLLLGGTVLLVNFTLGIWLGVLQARHRGRPIDRWLTRLSLALHAMPAFWVGLLLAAVVGVRWQWLPAAQMSDPLLPPGADFMTRALDVARHLVLPAITLSAVSIAGIMRYQRTALLEVLRLEYVQAARARGLTERRVIWGHAWRSALLPIVTLFGLWVPLLVAGAVFVESVFNWPGLGALAAEAIGARDYPLLMGTAIVTSGAVVLGSLMADVGARLLDPRLHTR